jgi:Family of unknown function (DUF5335)
MTPTTQEIQREAWRGYFDTLGKLLPTVEVTVEVIGEDLGDQFIGERVLLAGISYDEKDDVLVIGLNTQGGLQEEVEHLVWNPQQVMVTSLEDGSTAIEVEDAESHQTIIRYVQVPALPPE